MATGSSNATTSNHNGGPVTYEDVGLGTTANDQPWTGTYEQQVNANMRAFQTGMLRPFDGIEDPPSRHARARGWASCIPSRLLILACPILVLITGGVYVGIVTHNHSLPSDQITHVDGLNSTTTADFLATHGTLDIDVTVVLTQAPAPVSLAPITKTITVSQVSPSNAVVTTEPHLAPGKMATWTQTAQNGHCGFDTFTWVVSADGTSTSSTMIGTPSKPTLYDWCRADGDNQAAFESFWQTTLRTQTLTESFEGSGTESMMLTTPSTSVPSTVGDVEKSLAPKITSA